MSVQGGYPGTRAYAGTGIRMCVQAKGWRRQAQGWKGVEPPGLALPHGTGGNRDPSPGKAGLHASLVKHLLLIT